MFAAAAVFAWKFIYLIKAMAMMMMLIVMRMAGW